MKYLIQIGKNQVKPFLAHVSTVDVRAFLRSQEHAQVSHSSVELCLL